jgi:hypothetical protein
MDVYFKTILAILALSWVVGRIFHYIISQRTQEGGSLDLLNSLESEKSIRTGFFDWEVVFNPFTRTMLIPERIKSEAWIVWYQSNILIIEHLLAEGKGRFYFTLSFFNQVLNALIPWLFLLAILSYSEIGNKTFANSILILYAANVFIGILRVVYLRNIVSQATFLSLSVPSKAWALYSAPFFLSGKSLGDVFEKVVYLFRRS